MRHSLAVLLLVPLGLVAQAGEHLSPYGLKPPVLVVAGDLPKDFENKDNLAIVHAGRDPLPAGFQVLDKASNEPNAGNVGVHLPAGAVFKIDGRKMSNAGSGVITLRLAKSKRRGARSVELEGSKTADYNELRRCAFERAAGSPNPPEKPGEPVVSKGTLVIVGGGGTTPEINKAFLDAGGGPDGHFVVLPVSMPDPINVQREEQFLKRLGAKNITVLPQREQKDLETPEVIAALKKATGLWFGGGRQWNFIDAYEGTKLPALFREVLDRGGVIGGSSAGATIQGDYLVRGAPAGPQIMMCEGYERGLAFLPGVAIDQHFSARNRFKDMTALRNTYHQFLGIGLDEATAIVVRGSTAEVLGKGKVYVYDRRTDLAPDYEALEAGDRYDLKTRTRMERKQPPLPDPDPKKLFNDTARSMAVVKCVARDDQPRTLTGFVIDREQRLLLIQDPGEVKSIRAAFAMFDKDGTLVNDPKAYATAIDGDLSRTGKVLHRDEKRHLAVVQLEKELPAAVMALQLSAKDPVPGMHCWRVGAVDDTGKLWDLEETVIRATGWSIQRPDDKPAGFSVVVPRGDHQKTDAVLLNRLGEMTAFGIPVADQVRAPEIGNTTFLQFQFVSASEVRHFLARQGTDLKNGESPSKR